MIKFINDNQGPVSFLGVIVSLISFFLSGNKLLAGIILAGFVFLIFIFYIIQKYKPVNFEDTQKSAKILFIDDKDCQIVTSLRRNNFDVRKIDDVESPATDTDV
jgi:hypothetical protein